MLKSTAFEVLFSFLFKLSFVLVGLIKNLVCYSQFFDISLKESKYPLTYSKVPEALIDPLTIIVI